MNFHKFPPTKFIFGLLNSKHVTVYGYRLYMDRYDFTITPDIANDSYEPEETKNL